MKSICFVATSPYAVNFFILGHLRALAERYRITLCINLAAYPLTPDLDPRIAVVDLPVARKIAPLQDLRALSRLIWILRRGDFAAVHSITPKAGLLAMLAGFLCRVPHRMHVFTGQVWATQRGAKRGLLKLMDRLTIACASRVFSDSISQSRFIERELHLRAGRVGVLGKGSVAGVDIGRFRPDSARRAATRARTGTPEARFVFLFVGRLTRDKGVFDLIAAFRGLRETRDDVGLWMVGPDDEGIGEPLRAAAGVANAAIHWEGPTFAPEDFMAAADVLVLPSYREGFGMVIVEAAACGVSAIAYEINGVIDAVVDGVTGDLVAAGDTAALRDRMERMAADIHRTRALGTAARAHAVADFTADAVTGAWVADYARTVGWVEKTTQP